MLLQGFWPLSFRLVSFNTKILISQCCSRDKEELSHQLFAEKVYVRQGLLIFALIR